MERVDHNDSDIVERALGALRTEAPVELSVDLDSLRAAADTVRRRRAARRRALAPIFAVASLALGATGAYAAMNPEWAAGVLRRVFMNVTLRGDNGEETVVRLDVIESPAGAAHAQTTGVGQLSLGLTDEEEKADLLLGLGVGPGGAVAEEIVDGERRIVARDSSGAITGSVTLSEDGSTVTASGNGYIFINNRKWRLKRADVNDDGAINGLDLLAVFGAFHTSCDCPADIDGDGVVDVADLRIVIEAIVKRNEP